MNRETGDVARAFDERAARYDRNDWHRVYAESLVALSPLHANAQVLDAGTGTGFAALAAARRIGPGGRVVAVDVSRGMLERAQSSRVETGSATIQWLEGDATNLPVFADESFDFVLSSASLLYMPVAQALTEWRRLLKPGGSVGFSSMRAGSPPAGRLFRACAAAFDISLEDPSGSLGSEENCVQALQRAGFANARVVPGEVMFGDADLEMAWESNLRSARHAAVRMLTPEQQETMRRRFEAARHEASSRDDAFHRARVLYAFAVK